MPRRSSQDWRPSSGKHLVWETSYGDSEESVRGGTEEIARGGGEVGQSYARGAIGVKATLEIQGGETITADSPFFYHLPRLSTPPANGSVRPKAFELSQRKGEREPLFVESTLLYTTWRTDKH